MKTMKIKYLFFSIIICLFLITTAQARTVTFSWNFNPESENVRGYRIYYTTNSTATKTDLLIDVNATTNSYISIDELDNETKYYLVCRAYNISGESEDSDEVILDKVSNGATEDINFINFHFDWTTEQITLKWTNPTTLDKNGNIIPENTDFKGTMIRYNIGQISNFPTTHTEGTLFADVNGTLDSNSEYTGDLTTGYVYRFSFFTYDIDGNYSE